MFSFKNPENEHYGMYFHYLVHDHNRNTLRLHYVCINKTFA